MLDNLLTVFVGAAADISASLKTLNKNLATLNEHIANGAVAVPTPITLADSLEEAKAVAANIDKVVATQKPKVQKTAPKVAPSPQADDSDVVLDTLDDLEADEPTKECSFDEVKELTTVALKQLGKEAVMGLIAKHGATGLSKLDKAVFGEFVADLKEAMGVHDTPF